MPDIHWRLASSFPKNLDILHGTADAFARTVADATDGRFRIEVFTDTDIDPGMSALDAVSGGSVEMCQTASYYYVAKDPAFAFGTGVPVGLNSRQQNAWMYEAGGIDLLNAFYGKFGVYGLPGGNTGAQMGGWFRKEINSLADLNGLRMRIGGLGAAVLAKLGVLPQQVAVPDINTALQQGALDAVEWVGPYDDEQFGFWEVAKYYYNPGWWDGNGMVHFFIGLDAWNALPTAYRSIVTAAAGAATTTMQSTYDALNPGALRGLTAKGAVLRRFSPEIMEASFRAANEVFAEKSAKSADFRRIFEAFTAFRREEYSWFGLAEGSYDDFMYAQSRAGAL
jgi:TRAP-type mannitol/chloroaromatic compound transport system substrate-binding protein